MDDDYDKLEKQQRLKSAIYHSMKQISKEVEDDMEVNFSAQVLATLSETLNQQLKVYAMDLENFAKHARRTNINVDDVMLLARRNATLVERLASINTEKTAQHGHKKKAKVAAKKTREPEPDDC